MTTRVAANIAEEKPALSHWVPAYTWLVTLAGAFILILAFLNPPSDVLGLSILAGLAIISELTNVELFRSSHTNVSISMIIAIASILVLGPHGAALVCAVSGVVTGAKMALGQKERPADKRASWARRSAFNAGMYVISAFSAGWVYILSDGTIGQTVTLWDFLPLTLAVISYVIVNLALLMGVIVLQTGRNAVDIWRQDFSWSVPINILGGIIGGGVLALAYEMFSILGLAVFFLPVLTTSYSFRVYANNMRGLVNRLEEINRDLDEANVGLLHTMGAVIDAYDVYTYGHSSQVAMYAKAIGEKMGRPKNELDALFRAGLIHDIGKIGITETIIGKQGRLTDEEYAIVKRHVTIGADIVAQMQGLHALVPLVKHHHERWDGKGYPDGLQGERIPFEARILTLADSLDSMLSDRPYRQTMSFEDVIAEVQRCSGTQFDPQVVAAFMDLAAEKGEAYFKNSAAAVDEAVQAAGSRDISRSLRYLKKSMIAGS